MMPERRIHAWRTQSREKARDTTLVDEKGGVRQWACPRGKSMSDGTQHDNVVMALCNQPEAFASDLGDDQSLTLIINTRPRLWKHFHLLQSSIALSREHYVSFHFIIDAKKHRRETPGA